MVDRVAGISVNQLVAGVLGAVYSVVGVAGFFVSENFISKADKDLLGFQVNQLHDAVHLLIGLALIAAAERTRNARLANRFIGGTYLLLGLAGPFIDDTALDVIALDGADSVLHVASGLVLLAVSSLADRGIRT